MKKKIIILLLLLMPLGVGIFFIPKESTLSTETKETVMQTKKTNFTLQIKNGDRLIEVPINTDKVILYDALIAEDAVNQSISLTTKEFTFDNKKSYFLEKINSLPEDSTKQFWSFSINGKMSEIGIADYSINAGDVILFELTDIK